MRHLVRQHPDIAVPQSYCTYYTQQQFGTQPIPDVAFENVLTDRLRQELQPTQNALQTSQTSLAAANARLTIANAKIFRLQGELAAAQANAAAAVVHAPAVAADVPAKDDEILRLTTAMQKLSLVHSKVEQGLMARGDVRLGIPDNFVKEDEEGALGAGKEGSVKAVVGRFMMVCDIGNLKEQCLIILFNDFYAILLGYRGRSGAEATPWRTRNWSADPQRSRRVSVQSHLDMARKLHPCCMRHNERKSHHTTDKRHQHYAVCRHDRPLLSTANHMRLLGEHPAGP